MARVLIFGATSTIAAACAEHYARRGDSLHLIGRNPEKLAAIAARFNMADATCADLTLVDPEVLVRDVLAQSGPVDVVLIAHGDLGDQMVSEASVAEAERILRVNFVSVVGLLIPLANAMAAEGRGRIGVITSVAGDRGRPRNYTYGAAKGALNIYLQGLRSRLYPANVAVTTLKVGPVDTPMTVHHRKNMFFATADPVARAIVRAIDRRAGEVYVPGYWWLIMAVVRRTPEWLFQRLSFLVGR